jgi:hypothetical protein
MLRHEEAGVRGDELAFRPTRIDLLYEEERKRGVVEALAVIKQGTSLTVCSAGGRVKCTLYYEENNPDGDVRWMESRVGGLSGSLLLSQVTDIFVAKQDAYFEGLDEMKCMTIQTKTAVLYGATQLKSDLNAWIVSMSHILSHSANREVKTMQEERPDDAGADVGGGEADALLAAKSVLKGQALLCYQDSAEGPVGRDIFLHVSGGIVCVDESAANRYSGEKGSSARADLSLRRLCQIIIGKQFPVSYLTSVAKEAKVEQCFSLVFVGTTLHLQAQTRQQVQSCVEGLGHLLRESSANLSVSEGTGSGPGAHVVIDVTQGPVKKEAGTVSSAEDDIDATILTMEQGEIFTVFGSAEAPVRERCCMFLDPAEGKYGTMYWCPVGRKDKSQKRQSISLHTITDIYLGKRQPVFELELAKDAVENRCLSLISRRKREFHAEAHRQTHTHTHTHTLTCTHTHTHTHTDTHINRYTHRHTHTHTHTRIHTHTHTHTNTHTYTRTHAGRQRGAVAELDRGSESSPQ